jgi:hypothetical protein
LIENIDLGQIWISTILGIAGFIMGFIKRAQIRDFLSGPVLNLVG